MMRHTDDDGDLPIDSKAKLGIMKAGGAKVFVREFTSCWSSRFCMKPKVTQSSIRKPKVYFAARVKV